VVLTIEAAGSVGDFESDPAATSAVQQSVATAAGVEG